MLLKQEKLNFFGINVIFFFRIGLMHVVAANIILWIRTLIKESLEEIEEYEFEEIEKMKLEKMEVCNNENSILTLTPTK